MLPRRAARFATFATILALPLAPPARAASLHVPLTFGALPSAQGFTYVATGAHAGVPEGNVFSLGGGALLQNTVGQSNGVAGGGIYYERTGGITTSEPKTWVVRARCLAVQAGPVYTLGQGGFAYLFATGSTQYGFGLTANGIFVIQPSGYVFISGSYDNTQFHDYRYEWTPPGTGTLYRDNVLVDSRSGGNALAASRILFGDTTGGANAHGETSFFEFLQGGATANATASWGRIKALYR